MSLRRSKRSVVGGGDECPGDACLRESLEELLPKPMEATLIRHLDSCQDCRRRLQLLAASHDFWREAAQNLGGDREDLPESPQELQDLLRDS
jgi:hypothetical protein